MRIRAMVRPCAVALLVLTMSVNVGTVDFERTDTEVARAAHHTPTSADGAPSSEAQLHVSAPIERRGDHPANASQLTSKDACDGEADAVWQNDRLAVEVPVPVVTFGVPDDDVESLDAELSDYTVDQVGPVLPTAAFCVHAAPGALASEFLAEVRRTQLSSSVLDANAMEDWLAAALPAYGFAVNPSSPTVVVLHLDAFDVGSHGWRVQGATTPAAYLEPVRVFGERTPLLVLDPSAVRDSYEVLTWRQDFQERVPSDATGTIARFVREATEFRLLQASLYPVPVAPCHAVTALVAIRSTNAAESAGLLRRFEDSFEPARIKSALDDLTGTDVALDVKPLSMPEDDPILDALSRGEFPGHLALREYLDLHFDRYHVDHPGCERYLSVVFIGEPASASPVRGIQTYAGDPYQRISMSWVSDLDRPMFNPEDPVCYKDCESISWYRMGAEGLLAHETGHLFGQFHPHEAFSRTSSTRDETSGSEGGSSDAFSSVWSLMSYQQGGNVLDFGAIERNNFRRNRAGFSLLAASENGRQGTDAWNAAMDAARNSDWNTVWEELATELSPSSSPHSSSAVPTRLSGSFVCSLTSRLAPR